MPPMSPKSTSGLRALCAVVLICFAVLAAGCKGYFRDSTARTAGEVTDDRGIHTAIKTKLISHGETRGWKIDVDVFRSQVTLSGYVQSETERATALELARNTKGVKDVADKLVVLPPPKI